MDERHIFASNVGERKPPAFHVILSAAKDDMKGGWLKLVVTLHQLFRVFYGVGVALGLLPPFWLLVKPVCCGTSPSSIQLT